MSSANLTMRLVAEGAEQSWVYRVESKGLKACGGDGGESHGSVIIQTCDIGLFWERNNYG